MHLPHLDHHDITAAESVCYGGSLVAVAGGLFAQATAPFDHASPPMALAWGGLVTAILGLVGQVSRLYFQDRQSRHAIALEEIKQATERHDLSNKLQLAMLKIANMEAVETEHRKVIEDNRALVAEYRAGRGQPTPPLKPWDSSPEIPRVQAPEVTAPAPDELASLFAVLVVAALLFGWCLCYAIGDRSEWPRPKP